MGDVTGAVEVTVLDAISASSREVQIAVQNDLGVSAKEVKMRSGGKFSAYVGEKAELAAGDAELGVSGTFEAFAGDKAALTAESASMTAERASLRADSVKMRSTRSMRLDAVEEVTVDSRSLKFGGGSGRVRLSSTPLTSRVTINSAETSAVDEEGFVQELSTLLGVPSHRLRMVNVEDVEE